jgi:hypothetical protein
MSRWIRTCGLAVILSGFGAGLGTLSPAVGESPPPEQVTSDTPAYCQQLAQRLDRLRNGVANPPQAVNDLSAEGKHMCDQGLTRGGILRLRSAIVLLLHHSPDDPVQVGRSQ